MVKEYTLISIREILSRILRHPLLQDVTLEQAVQYTIDFLYIFGIPKIYEDKEEVVEIKEYRGLLPCNLIAINQVKDCKSGLCLRGMTDTFMPHHPVRQHPYNAHLTFKTQGQVIFTSFKKGDILISYKSIPVDKDGYPMLMDNAVFLKTLEAYIKKEAFTILFDMGKINNQVYQNTLQQYSWLAGQLQNEMSTPSISEMESIKNSWCTLIQRVSDFDRGFRGLGDKEKIKLH